jgi:hypothetical protein
MCATCPTHLIHHCLIILTIFGVPHYAILSSLRSLRASQARIFSSAPCSETSSICVLPLMWESRFHTHFRKMETYSFAYVNIYVLNSRTKEKWFWTARQYAFRDVNFLNATLSCHHRSQVSELCHIFSGFISYLYIMSFTCGLVTRHEHSVLTSAFTSRSVS